MPFYTGNTADGSDMREIEGVYLSKDGKTWSNMPFKPDAEDRLYNTCLDHTWKNLRTFRQEYELIIQKKSQLPRSCRDYLVRRVENEIQLESDENKKL